ncbi:hypothetical protein PVAG01_02218 [Phlyctema vagabunda]|uniref:Uncharacterized protein n=1 Tax=Phlyctema vagabunda TaxID=108571 RepID=A0ABR4PQ05_9HELO
MAQLSNGNYLVSPLVAEESFVSRFYIEDKSLLPKRVVLINDPNLAQKWHIENAGANRFRLSISGAVIAPRDDHVFAHLINENEDTQWELEPSPQHGPNVFVVKTSDGKGWVLPDTEERTQLSYKPLAPASGSPPNELFKFTQCGDD